MTVSAPDRLQALLAQDEMSGIDFVHVSTDQVRLTVHFHKPPGKLNPPLDGITPGMVHILPQKVNGNGRIAPAVTSVRWDQPFQPHLRKVLHVRTETPGDYSPYILRIDHPQIDPYFNNVQFSFKAHCLSEIDCKREPHRCPPEEQTDFPIDYQARDFWSLRRALMEFASQRYPKWQDRGREADFGVMFAEILCALGDELAYYQDRVAREAYLETATQRRSLRRHARLVDYTVHDGLGAKTWLDLRVKEGVSAVIPAGFDVGTLVGDGRGIAYEVGRELREMLIWRQLIDEIKTGGTIDVWDATDPCMSKYGLQAAYRVDWRRNDFQPHCWDEDDTCLPVGTTEFFIEGHHEDSLVPFDDCPEEREPGRWMLLKTLPINPALLARAWLVRVVLVENTSDPLLDRPITRLVWEQEQALPFEMDLKALQVRGNLIPVVAGRTEEQQFRIRKQYESTNVVEPVMQDIVPAVERCGADGSIAYFFSLPATAEENLAWVGDDVKTARPEIALVEKTLDETTGIWISGANFREPCEKDPNQWCWRRSLLGVQSSQPYDKHFTLDDGTWDRVVGYQRIGKEIIHVDYKSDQGVTIRFGDGEFGSIPSQGKVFKVFYRIGGGRKGNVPEEALTWFDPESDVLDSAGNLSKAADLIKSVINPLPAVGGIDPETEEEVRQLAPDAFRGLAYRAVTREDYAEAAERLSWVQRAGSSFRWTGSWLSCFVTPDPYGAVVMASEQRSELERQLDRFRQAGREVNALNPKYADLDLEIQICVDPSSYRGQVKERVMQELLGKADIFSAEGFFSPDNFTFGTPLERSLLESVIQDVPGVRAVTGIKIARRGYFELKDFTDLVYTVAKDEVIRVENDLNHPDRGSVKLEMIGGA